MSFIDSEGKARLLMFGPEGRPQHIVDAIACVPDRIEYLGQVADSPLELEAIDTESPFVILADVMDKDLQRLQHLIASIQHLPAAVLAIIPEIEKPLVLSLLRLGVRGIVTGDAKPDNVVKAIEGVGAGEIWVSRELLYEALSREVGRDPAKKASVKPNNREIWSKLTPREQDILFCLREGLSDKEIARELDISHKTVKTHLQHIFKKTSIHSRLQLAMRV